MNHITKREKNFKHYQKIFNAADLSKNLNLSSLGAKKTCFYYAPEEEKLRCFERHRALKIFLWYFKKFF